MDFTLFSSPFPCPIGDLIVQSFTLDFDFLHAPRGCILDNCLGGAKDVPLRNALCILSLSIPFQLPYQERERSMFSAMADNLVGAVMNQALVSRGQAPGGNERSQTPSSVNDQGQRPRTRNNPATQQDQGPVGLLLESMSGIANKALETILKVCSHTTIIIVTPRDYVRSFEGHGLVRHFPSYQTRFKEQIPLDRPSRVQALVPRPVMHAPSPPPAVDHFRPQHEAFIAVRMRTTGLLCRVENRRLQQS